MFIIGIIAAIILICIIFLILKMRGGRSGLPARPDRFQHEGPGDPKPEKPRATGVD